jgi:hypothetical protein
VAELSETPDFSAARPDFSTARLETLRGPAAYMRCTWGILRELTNRLQSEHPAPPVDRAARSVVCGVAVDVAGDVDGAVPEQIGDGFDVHAGFKPADRY